jgi:hypothetical protein
MYESVEDDHAQELTNSLNEAIIHGMSIETDNYGQLVIYTHLKENDDGKIEEMTAEDFAD